MSDIDKKSLTERDICTKFINPALEAAGWDLMHQIREQHYFTDGRVMVRGKTVKRGDRKFADYLLFHQPNVPLAIIEAKDNNHSVGSGMCDVLEASLTTAESASTQLLSAAVHHLLSDSTPNGKTASCPM